MDRTPGQGVVGSISILMQESMGVLPELSPLFAFDPEDQRCWIQPYPLTLNP